MSVRGEFDGRDWWFVRGVEAPTGAERLTIELPASTHDRMAARPNPSLQIYLDGRAVDHRFDEPQVAFL